MIYLDFEKPIQELDEQLEKLKAVAEKSKVDMSKSIAELEAKMRRCKARSSSS